MLQLNNVYLYFLGYGLVTALTMLFMPKDKRKKILTYTPQGSTIEKLSTTVSLISRYGAMGLSIFLPISWNQYTFWIGNILYVIGLTLATIAMWQFAKVRFDKPITTGIYRITRNPMQVMGFVMNIGIALIGNRLFFWILTVINIITSYPMFLMQEQFCLDKYGKKYADYMKKTPRILLIRNKK